MSSVLVGSVILASPVSIARPAAAALPAPANTASAANPFGAEEVGSGPSPAVPMDHGAWTSHTYILTDPSPSSYEVYGRVYADQPHDYAYARVLVWNTSAKTTIVDKSASCGEIDEGCINTRTTGSSFSQGYFEKKIHFWGCAYDDWTAFGGHYLGGGPLYQGCDIQTPPAVFLGAHEHWSVPFS